MRVIASNAKIDRRTLLRGVVFEEYDFPGFDKATSIAWVNDHSAAWFKDTEGNLLVIVQLSAGAIDRPDA